MKPIMTRILVALWKKNSKKSILKEKKKKGKYYKVTDQLLNLKIK